MIPEVSIPPPGAPGARSPSPTSTEGDNGHDGAAHGGKSGNERPTEPPPEPGAGEAAPPQGPTAKQKRREKQRRYEFRQRAGIRVYGVEADNTDIDLMIALGWIGEDETLDRDKVSGAIGRMVRQVLLTGQEPDREPE